MRRLALLSALVVWGGCSKDDGGVNPPPKRVAPTPTPTKAASPPTSLAVKADFELHRPEKIGRVVVRRLEDLLPGARLAGPHVDVDPILKTSIRAFPNPWARGAHSNLRWRFSWTTGARNRWDLRAGIVLPAGTTAAWRLPIPASARLRFDIAVGTRGAGKPVVIAVLLDDEEVWTERTDPIPLGELRTWRPVEVDLARFAGRNTTIAIRVEGEVVDHPRDVALLAEPVITTRDGAAAKAATGLTDADNVILVVVDSQRVDTLSPMRPPDVPALFPTMEGLVREGTVFTFARSVGDQTRLSTYSFLASQDPTYARFHIRDWDFEPEQKAVFYALDPPLLPRVLRQVGYRTAHIGNNAFMFGNYEIALDTGFDAVTDHRNSDMDTPWMTDTAIEWIQRYRDERFFLVLGYNAPHNPYVPPDDSWLGFKPKLAGIESLNWGYLGEIHYVDQHLARLLAQVEALGLKGRTLVILTADHGEIMDPKHRCYSVTFDYRCMHSHGITQYEEELRVPLVFHQPGRVPAEAVRTEPVSLLDLAPTVLGLLGFEPHPEHLGRDLSAAVLGGPPPEEVPTVIEGRLTTAVVWRGHKYLVHDPTWHVRFGEPGLYDRDLGQEELYHLAATDWTERKNLITAAPSMLDEIRGVLRDYQEDRLARRPEWSHVRLHAGAAPARFAGRIVTNGRFVSVEPATTPRDGDGVLRIDLALDEGVRSLRFQTVPPQATVSFELSLDDEPLPVDRLYVGAWGLELLEEPSVDTAAERASAEAPVGGPPIVTAVQPGVFYWRVRQGGPRSGRGTSQGLDSSVKQMMRDWGYN